MASGTIKAVVPKSDIVNDLNTNDSTKVLSAAQGYSLSNQIAKYGNLEITTKNGGGSENNVTLDTGSFTFGLLVGYHRSTSNQDRSGYAIVFMYDNTAIITSKTGLSQLSAVSYNSGVLTVTSSYGYMTYAFLKLL